MIEFSFFYYQKQITFELFSDKSTHARPNKRKKFCVIRIDIDFDNGLLY
jgi:hypothetical protein